MVEEDSAGERHDEIVFHFDVESHSIPLRQFIETAEATKLVIDDFNNQLFDNQIRYHLRVRPPEPGGLAEVLQIVIGGGSVLGFLSTEIGKAFFKGLTGEEPAHWAEQIGKKIRNSVVRRLKSSREISSELSRELKADILLPDKKTEAAILVKIVVSFLEVEVKKLEHIGIAPSKFRKAYKARNTIYKACIENPEVKGLSFNRSHHFPLQRRDFPKQITLIPEVADSDEKQQTAWSVDIVDIVVNSPNWKKDGRKWQAATNRFQDISFAVEDDTFWHHVELKDIKPDIKDNMRVQWAYPAGLSKPSQQVRVLKVLSYNGKPISDPLSEDELKQILDEPYLQQDDVLDLFRDNVTSSGDGGKN